MHFMFFKFGYGSFHWHSVVSKVFMMSVRYVMGFRCYIKFKQPLLLHSYILLYHYFVGIWSITFILHKYEAQTLLGLSSLFHFTTTSLGHYWVIFILLKCFCQEQGSNKFQLTFKTSQLFGSGERVRKDVIQYNVDMTDKVRLNCVCSILVS